MQLEDNRATHYLQSSNQIIDISATVQSIARWAFQRFFLYEMCTSRKEKETVSRRLQFWESHKRNDFDTVTALSKSDPLNPIFFIDIPTIWRITLLCQND